MRFSYLWLKEFLPELSQTPEELAEPLLWLGFELSHTIPQRPDHDSQVIVAQIEAVEKHPQADRLSLCRVTDGQRSYSIVCGAENLSVGQKVPLARIGAKIAQNRKIEKVKIRGIFSEGMLCSGKELAHNEDSSGIWILPSDTPLGSPLERLLPPPDTALEVEIPPNRPDCLSHLGLARELAVKLRLRLQLPEAKDPILIREAPNPPGTPFPVEIENSSDCPRYLAIALPQAIPRAFPDGMRRRLETCGLRSIHPIVDLTQYVLLELGHPTHAFDLDCIQEKIVVRRAAPHETLKALDGQLHRLSPECLVIADARRPLALAGILGGEDSGVAEKTRNVLLECATFRPSLIRRTAKSLRLQTQASLRFEKGIAPENVSWAARRLIDLLTQEIGIRERAITDRYPAPPARPVLEISLEALGQRLGLPELAREETERILKPCSENLEKTTEGWRLTPIPQRPDLQGPWSIEQELARHLGYDRIPERELCYAPSILPEPPAFSLEQDLKDLLQHLGWTEVCNYDFTNERELGNLRWDLEASPAVRLANPLSSEVSLLRPTHLPGLLRNVQTNLRQGREALQIFEVGTTYHLQKNNPSETRSLAAICRGEIPSKSHWQKSKAHSPDFFDLKGWIEKLLIETRKKLSLHRRSPSTLCFLHPVLSEDRLTPQGPELNKEVLVSFGQIHPLVCEAWGLGQTPLWFLELDLDRLTHTCAGPPRYRPLAKYPASQRDFSVLVSKEHTWSLALEALQTLSHPLIRQMELLDVFEGVGLPRGRKSWTMRFTFASPEKTLQEQEILEIQAQILKVLENRLGAVLRS
ncbi:MAG: phenylalanine--tRNA ligase subunit beta [Elusimicrobia bacterium]|nr:phenylalanine--tRNA ligase subunit beta [Elusimicrobiota bacterium]